MAIAAFCLELGMPFGKGARHDEFFQQILGAGAARCGDRQGRGDYQCAFDTADQRCQLLLVLMNGPNVHNAC